MRNLLGDYKITCHEENASLHQNCLMYIEALNDVQEENGLTLSNKLKKKNIMWTKHIMNVHIGASVEAAIDFLWNEINHPPFGGSEATS